MLLVICKPQANTAFFPTTFLVKKNYHQSHRLLPSNSVKSVILNPSYLIFQQHLVQFFSPSSLKHLLHYSPASPPGATLSPFLTICCLSNIQTGDSIPGFLLFFAYITPLVTSLTPLVLSTLMHLSLQMANPATPLRYLMGIFLPRHSSPVFPISVNDNPTFPVAQAKYLGDNKICCCTFRKYSNSFFFFENFQILTISHHLHHYHKFQDFASLKTSLLMGLLVSAASSHPTMFSQPRRQNDLVKM